MIEFNKVQEEVFILETVKFSQASFCKRPERFDAIDVIFAPCKFILGVEKYGSDHSHLKMSPS